MDTCAEALDVIRRRTGERCSAAGAEAIEFEIEHVVRVELRIADDRKLILRAQLRDVTARLDRRVLAELLKANAYGQSTGAARLALDPDDDCPVLLMSLAVQGHDEASLVRQVMEFVNHAAYWQTLGSDDLESVREKASLSPLGADRWDEVVLVRV